MKIDWFRSLYYNYKLLPCKQAVKMPILVGYKTYIHISKRGTIKVSSNTIYRGMIMIGVDYEKCISSKDEQTLIDVAGFLEFCGSANIGKGTKMVVLPKGKLYVGNSFVITGHSSFRIYRYAKIGNNCLFSWDILLMDYDGHRIFDAVKNRINDHRPLIIGDNVWIGCRTSIWDGAWIPEGSIIGNNSCIRKELFVKNSIYVEYGKLVKRNCNWEI